MYNFTANRVASEVRADLSRLVTDAKRTAPKEEHSLIELAGQAAHVALDGIDDDNLVELQAYGSSTPSAGARTFFVSVNARQIKSRDASPTPPVADTPWTPDQGPLGPVRSTTPATTETAAPAGKAAVG